MISGSKSFDVLIVDDNPEFIQSLSHLLVEVAGSKIGTIQRAHNVHDGVDLMRRHSFEYLFIGVKMTTVDKITALRRLKNNNSLPKIVAMSFHAEFVFVNQVLQAGADVHLVKDDIDHNALEPFFNS